MKLTKGILLEVTEADLDENGRFISKEVKEVAEWCFYKLPSLKEVILPNCEKVADNCFRYNKALTSVSLPALTTCGGYCFRYNQALTSVSLPALTTCGGDCFSSNQALTSVSLPALTTCGGDCFSYNQALTSVSLPALTTCGGYCFSSNQALTSVSLPALTTCGGDCFRYNQALTSVSLKKELKVKNVDGWPFVIEGKRTSKGIAIYNGYNFYSMKDGVVEKQDCYVSEKDGFTAHGKTVKKAIADLHFKIVAEKLKKEPIKPDTMITVNHYRLVTGACELGVKAWMDQNGLTGTEEMRADALLPILKKTNAYGLERFKQLIDF